jgi:hypothetical protein
MNQHTPKSQEQAIEGAVLTEQINRLRVTRNRCDS